MNKKFVDYFMSIADLTAKLSVARRLQVGAVLVKDNQIIGTGYNGTPAGWDNDCEHIEFMPWKQDIHLDPTEIWHQYPLEGTFWINGEQTTTRYRLKTKPEVIHAESNCLTKVARSTESSDGATMFCTHAPCLECAKLIYQSGVKNLYYRATYRENTGLEFLERANVQLSHYKS